MDTARTPLRQLQRARIAHHESGHAIVGRALGLKVGRVAVGNGGGSVKLGDFNPDRAQEELCFFYAGLHAEVRFLTTQGYSKGRASSIARPNAAHDFRQVRSVVAWMRRHHNTRLSTSRANSDAARLVNRHWRAIESMAARHGGGC